MKTDKPNIENCPKESLGSDAERIFLLSNTFASRTVYDHCDFAVTGTQNFRFLNSSVADTENYADLSANKQEVKVVRKSGKYNLLSAGSVLYPNNTSQILQDIRLERLRQIGYNYFIHLTN